MSIHIRATLVLVSVIVFVPATAEWTTSAVAGGGLGLVDSQHRKDAGPGCNMGNRGGPYPGGVPALDIDRYADGPPAGHTGGFGEPTCRRCHFDQPMNDPGTRLVVEGVPAVYGPSRTYQITLELHRDGLGRGGFQMAARFIGPRRAGHQAGAFHALSDRVRVLYDDNTGIEYIQHTQRGSAPTAAQRATWSFEWQAPLQSDDMVVFHLAANAANNDASEFGDFVVVRRLFATRVGN